MSGDSLIPTIVEMIRQHNNGMCELSLVLSNGDTLIPHVRIFEVPLF